MNIFIVILFATAACVQCVGSATPFLLIDKVPEDALANFTQLAAKYGQHSKEYEALTDDGYILKLFRLPGTKGPVLLLHGMMCSADAFLLRGHTSLPARLTRAGYDVWLGNVRGNRYSRRHLTLDPKDPLFWQFSYHHQGIFDLPALIDVVLKHTRAKSLRLIGISQGATSTFVMASEHPEYTGKIQQFVALGPVAYLNDLPDPLKSAVENHQILSAISRLAGVEEMPGYDSGTRELMAVMCSQRSNRAYCNEMMFRTIGFDPSDYEPELLPMLMTQMSMGTSRMNLVHHAQVVLARRFQQFDHGVSGNLRVYGAAVPPEYDLSKSTMPTYVFSAKNDKLALPANVALLLKQLPNVVASRVMGSRTFNHMGFIWGRTGHRLTADYVLDIFERGNSGFITSSKQVIYNKKLYDS